MPAIKIENVCMQKYIDVMDSQCERRMSENFSQEISFVAIKPPLLGCLGPVL